MISRANIYDAFIKYVNVNIVILNNKISYYNDRINISNNKLTIFKDSLLRHKTEVKIIYGIEVDNVDNSTNSVIYINNVVLVNSNSINTVISKLKSVDIAYDVHTVNFVKSIMSNYSDIKKELININRQIQLLNDKLMFFNKYKDISKNMVYYIISKINKYYESALLEGEHIHLGNHIGFIKVTPKKVKGKTNWNASFEYRDMLIADGKIPYKKEDAIKAKKAGIKYEGVRWFVYYENEIQHYINWYCYGKLPNKQFYTFKPARYNKTNKKISDIKKEISSIKELDNLKLGIVNKLNIALDINELQFVKYVRDDL